MLEARAPTNEALAAAAEVPSRLEDLAAIGRDPRGGITRLPLTTHEEQAVDLFAQWARAAGAEVVRDRFGNVFALRGDWEQRPGVMLGSHLDTVPNGGAYDGALGVVAGLSVLEGWGEPTPLCVVAFRAEEATLSPFGRLGSAVYTGALSYERAAELAGGDVEADLCGLKPARVSFPAGYLELHVEQGGRLEAQDITLGAVTGIAGYTRIRIRIDGRQDHVGSATMTMRLDALTAAAELVLEVEQLGLNKVDVASVGSLTVFPNAVGVVPARVELTADIRSITDKQRTNAAQELEQSAAEMGRRRGLAVRTEVVAIAPAVRFPEEVVESVEEAAKLLGTSAVRIASGANHDAGNLASQCPSGMIFVPSREGRSHTPEEYTSPEACCEGALALGLAAAMLSRKHRLEVPDEQ